MTLRLLTGLILLAIATVSSVPAEATLAVDLFTTSVCGSGGPGGAATESLDFLPDDQGSGTANCASLCAKWSTLCRKAVAARLACFNKMRASFVALQIAECDTFVNTITRQTCKDTVRAERDTIEASTANSADNGFAYCDGTGLTQCLSNCN